jgi:hypothetical protein
MSGGDNTPAHASWSTLDQNYTGVSIAVDGTVSLWVAGDGLSITMNSDELRSLASAFLQIAGGLDAMTAFVGKEIADELAGLSKKSGKERHVSG